jgi:tripartite-type tricarboxylate transporter receptor subunit TctC
VFAAMVRTEEWKQDLEQNFWVNGYADARSAKKRLDEEYAEYKSILTEIGLAKIK